MRISGSNRSAYYRYLYAPLHFLAAWYLRLMFGGYRYDSVKLPEGGALIVANHTAGADPVFAGICIKNPMTFVLSEHLIRKRRLGALINALMANIVRVKARTESRTAYAIIRALKDNRKVMLFPEGSETYTGKTGRIMPGIGRLMKLSGATLVTLRLEGTFALWPRWRVKAARGRARGRIVHIFTPEDLSQMSADEIERAVARDIDYDFYQDAEAAGHPYKCPNPAEYLETALFICPDCGGVSTLRTKGDALTCACGLSLRLDGHLTFQSRTQKAAPFDNVRDFFLWQDQKLDALCAQLKQKGADCPITRDENVAFNAFTLSPPATTPLAVGALTLYPDRLRVEGENGFLQEIPLADITDITTVQRNNLYVCVNHEIYYEFKRKGTFSPVKYALFASRLSDMRAMVF